VASLRESLLLTGGRSDSEREKETQCTGSKLHRQMAREGLENSVHWFKTKGNQFIFSST
jgi:hypothetical protein